MAKGCSNGKAMVIDRRMVRNNGHRKVTSGWFNRTPLANRLCARDPACKIEKGHKAISMCQMKPINFTLKQIQLHITYCKRPMLNN
jgi:arginine deiminase